jgi:hypothetical protein
VTIKANVTGAFVNIDCFDVLALDDLPVLFRAFETARAKGPFVVVTDTTHMKSAPRHVLSAFADDLKRLPSLSNVWLGDAVVIRSTAVRFIVSTLLVVAPMPTEVQVFERTQEARAWCAGLLRKAGLIVPAELQRSA